jgi:hypothetical protein
MLLVKRLPDSFQVLVNYLNLCIGEHIREHLFCIVMKQRRCVLLMITVTPRVMLFPNYLYYKLSQASSAMVNQVVEVRNQNSKSGVRI